MRAPDTPYPLPPDRVAPPFPKSIPWDEPISDLSGFWLRIECEEHGQVLYPLRLMAAKRGWKLTLRTIVPKLRCKKCQGRPVRVALAEVADGDGHSTARGGEHVLAG